MYLIQPWGRKTGWSSFFSCPFTEECDLCKSFGWANREVSALNQLYSKSTVCLCFSTLIPKARSILLQVECIHRANILKVSRRVLYFPQQEPFSWFRKRHSTHSCFRTVNSMKKIVQRSTLLLLLSRICYAISIYGIIKCEKWQLGLPSLAVFLWNGQISVA